MRQDFERGLFLAAGLGLASAGIFYALVAHTPDMRARLGFLLAGVQLSLLLLVLAVPLALGLGALAFIGGLTAAAVRGAMIGSIAIALVIATGALERLIPPTAYEGPPRYGVSALLVAGAVVLVWRARRSRQRVSAGGASVGRTA